MGTTRQIPPDEWKETFDRFTKQHLQTESPEVVTIEVVSPEIGDQFEARSARLEGVSYDPKSSAFEVWMEDLDHLVFYPAEIWVIEEDGGFVSTVEIVRADGGKEILNFQRSGPPATLHEQPSPAGG
jgi:hypothetical protein